MMPLHYMRLGTLGMGTPRTKVFLCCRRRPRSANTKGTIERSRSTYRIAVAILVPKQNLDETLPGRLELPTLRLTASRSNQLS